MSELSLDTQLALGEGRPFRETGGMEEALALPLSSRSEEAASEPRRGEESTC